MPNLYTVSATFDLSGIFTDATLTITQFSVDDRGVLLLNGTLVASEGIFGPGAGFMVLTPGCANDAFTFAYTQSGPFLPIASGFVIGTNTLSVLVNDTNAGIGGNLSGGVNCGFTECLAPTGVSFSATLSFNTSAVPLPATLPLFGVGVLMAATRARRRRAVGG